MSALDVVVRLIKSWDIYYLVGCILVWNFSSALGARSTCDLLGCVRWTFACSRLVSVAMSEGLLLLFR